MATKRHNESRKEQFEQEKNGENGGRQKARVLVALLLLMNDRKFAAITSDTVSVDAAELTRLRLMAGLRRVLASPADESCAARRSGRQGGGLCAIG
jgi:hypothetical protein